MTLSFCELQAVVDAEGAKARAWIIAACGASDGHADAYRSGHVQGALWLARQILDGKIALRRDRKD